MVCWVRERGDRWVERRPMVTEMRSILGLLESVVELWYIMASLALQFNQSINADNHNILTKNQSDPHHHNVHVQEKPGTFCYRASQEVSR